MVEQSKVARRAQFTLLVVLALWSFGPPLSKKITASPGAASFVRLPLGLAFHLVLLVVSRQRLTLVALKRTILPGVLTIANMLLFFAALRQTSVANLVILSSLQTPVTMFLAAAMLGETIRRSVIAWTFVGIAGTAFAITGSSNSGSTRTTAVGLVLSAAAMASFTGFLFASKRARGKSDQGEAMHPIVFMTGVMFTASVIAVANGLLFERDHLGQFDGRDLVWASILAVGPSMANILITWCHAYVPMRISSLVLLVQPVTTSLLSWLINSQPLSWQQAVGGLVVVLAVGAIVTRQAPVPEVADSG